MNLGLGKIMLEVTNKKLYGSWVLLVLLSFLIIQFHGLSHVLESEHDHDTEGHHNCVICEVQSYHGPAINPTDAKI